MQETICLDHGHRTVEALDSEGFRKRISYALGHKKEDFYCTGCGIDLRPVRSGENRVHCYESMAHFRRKPGPAKKSPLPGKSERDNARRTIRDSLELSRDFDFIADDCQYVSENKKGEVWKELKSFPADVYAQKQGRSDINAVIHVMDLGKDKNANDIYRKLKELASESLHKKRRHIVSRREEIELPRRIYQNIVVIKNHDAYTPEGDLIRLNPTVYKYIKYFTDDINFFNLDELVLEPTRISSGKLVESDNKHESRMTFSHESEQVPVFTLFPNPPVRKEKPCSNRQGKRSILIPDWKLANIYPIRMNDQGRFMTFTRPDRQMSFLE